MKRQTPLIFVHAAFLLLSAPFSYAQRVALVIGNAAYQNEKPLNNPINDAELIAEVLRNDLQFDDVKLSKNLGRRDLSRQIAEFAQKAKGADAVFIYYSGHGMQRGGQNYLIPVDASIRDEADIDSEGVASAKLLAELENAAPKITVVVLDACRDNPYSTRSKSTTKGLARMGDVGEGMLVAYATRDGMTADDGSGRNSPYARALAQQLRNKQQPIRLTFEQVAEDVRTSTGNKQKPVTYGDLKSSARLLPFFSNGAPVQSPAQQFAVEEQTWEDARRANDIRSYELYLELFPKGRWEYQARAAMDALKHKQEEDEENSAWLAASSINSLASYKTYLEYFPKGRHTVEAKIQIAAYEDSKRRITLGSGNVAANALGGVVGLWRWTSIGPSAMHNGIVEITEDNSVLTGKVISYFPKPGDPANPVCDKCAGAKKGQPIIGLVVLEGLKKSGDTYEGGTILDPETGVVYGARAKLIDGGKKLEVRGFVGVSLIGRSQTWVREE